MSRTGKFPEVGTPEPQFPYSPRSGWEQRGDGAGSIFYDPLEIPQTGAVGVPPQSVASVGLAVELDHLSSAVAAAGPLHHHLLGPQSHSLDQADLTASLLLKGSPEKRSVESLHRRRARSQSSWAEAVAELGGTVDLVRFTSQPTLEIELQAPDLLRNTPEGCRWAWLAARVSGAPDVVRGAAVAFRRWLDDSAALPGVVTGFTHVDSTAHPFEWKVIDRSRLNTNEFSRQVPGYYGQLLLTGGHIDALGGEGVVLRDAPCERVAKRGPSAWTTCVREDWDEVGAGDFRALRSFLAPVMRPGVPALRRPGAAGADDGPPVWIFEGPPVPFFRSVLVGDDEELAVPLDLVGDAGAGEAVAFDAEIDWDGGAASSELLRGVVYSWAYVLRAGVVPGCGLALVECTAPSERRPGRLSWSVRFDRPDAGFGALSRLGTAVGELAISLPGGALGNLSLRPGGHPT